MKKITPINLSRHIVCVFALLSMALLGGCSKTNVTIEPSTGGNSGGSGNGGTATSNLITFHASVESLNLTKSLTPITTGTQATMFAFNAETDSLAAEGNYQSNSLGTLTGIGDYEMYLTDGTYDFYGVSTNSSQAAPSFSDTLSEPLSNGIDYLWWGVTGQKVSTTSVSMPIVFSHKAVQVVFEVNEGNGIVIDSLIAIATLAPAQGARMNLLTGNIPPATSSQVGFINPMGINGLMAQCILLPIDNWNYMAFTMQVLINGETQPRTYGGQVPIPNGQLLSGNSYLFKIILNANSIEIPSVSVTGWTIVDETGSPIYPGQLYP